MTDDRPQCLFSTHFGKLQMAITLQHRRRNRGGNDGACPRNVETAGAKVSFRPRNILPSLSAG